MFLKSISDVQYIYRMSDIPALALALALALAEVGYCILDVRYRYRTSDIGTRMSDIGTRMSDIGTRMSDIDIGRRIYILDVRYIYIGRLI